MINHRLIPFVGSNCFLRVLILSPCVLLGEALCPANCFAAQPSEPDWEPSPLDEIRAIWHDRPLSDIEIVRALAGHLDRRISMSRLIHKTPVNPNPPYEYGMLIGLIAERPYPAKPKGRPEAIETVMQSLGDVENEDELRSYLNLALGLAGGSPSEDAMLRILTDPKTPEEIVAVALDSMSKSKVPIRALPRLLELTEHPMNYVDPDCTRMTPPQRVFAIRDRVVDCMGRLGVKCEKSLVDDGSFAPGSDQRQPTTVVTVDRASLVEKLRLWIVSADESDWRGGMDALNEIPGADVDQLVTTLRADRTLPLEKARSLRELRR